MPTIDERVHRLVRHLITRTFSSLSVVALTVFLAGSLSFPADGAEPGSDELTTEQRGVTLSVFTYRPGACVPRSVLLVFHGNSRNADDYRDYARPFADKFCMSVYTPRFDRDRFRSWRYHRGGVIRRNVVQPPDEWTVSIIQDLAKWALAREGRTGKTLYLFGHSAGGQFLSRVAAYAPPTGARRFVVANPSSHVWPDLDEIIPYGFGWFPQATQALQRYLKLPLTIYLGSEDTGSRLLSKKAAAVWQGENRLERGRNAFSASRALAREEEWKFNWKMVIAPGVGHSGQTDVTGSRGQARLRPGWSVATNGRAELHLSQHG